MAEKAPYYAKILRPKVREVELDFEGEKMKFYFQRPPTGKMLEFVNLQSKLGTNDPEVTKSILQAMVVNPNGSPINDLEAGELLKMDPLAFRQVNAQIEKILDELKPAKPDEGESAEESAKN